MAAQTMQRRCAGLSTSACNAGRRATCLTPSSRGSSAGRWTVTDLLDYLAAVEAHADPDWKDEAERVIDLLASTRQQFTTDDVWQRLGHVSTHEPRAMGALMKRAASRGVIRATDGWATSTRPECHGRPIRVWRSAI